LRDLPSAVRGSYDVRIMTHDWNAVGGNVDVELDRISAGANRLSKRLDGVFGSVRAIAAVADDGPEFQIEEGVHLKTDLTDVNGSGTRPD